MTWARTVRSEMPSSRAISSLLNPWRMRPSTSSSRWEIRPPVGLGDDPKAVVERQHVGEPNPHDRVVIDEHHTNGERAGGGGHEVSCGFPARSSASVIGPGGPSLLRSTAARVRANHALLQRRYTSVHFLNGLYRSVRPV